MTRQFLKKVFHVAALAFFAVQALVLGQGSEALRVLGEMRAALGGDKLAAVKSFIASGTSARTAGQFDLDGEFEIICELPDKYVKQETLAVGDAPSTSTFGFSGGRLIATSPAGPVSTASGRVVMYRPMGGGMPGGEPATPEQKAAVEASRLRAAKADFARLTVALFGASFSGHPVEFTDAGQTDATDGKAHVIEVRGADDFHARLFIDVRTRHPLMVSWQGPAVSGVVNMRSASDGGQAGAEDRQRLMEERMREMQAAARRTVEHRLSLSDYRTVDGVRLPHRIVRVVDGATIEEMTVEEFKLNATIDEKKFR